MATVTPRTLSGFMELLPAPQQQMERMMEILRTTYSRYGFTPLDTPVIEASEVLLAKGGGETEKQIYRFQNGDADLSLRFDLTVPLAKYVALHYNDLAFPPVSDRQGIPGRAGPAGPLPGVLSGGHRHHRRRQAGHHQRGGDPLHHLSDLLHSGAEAVPDPGQQPEDPQRILRHVGPDGAVRRHHAHRGQAGQDRSRQGPDLPDGGRGTDGGAGRRDHAVHLHHRQQPAGTGRSGRVSGAARAVRPGSGGAEHRHPLSLRLRRSGGKFRRGSDHRPGPGLLHRHGV